MQLTCMLSEAARREYAVLSEKSTFQQVATWFNAACQMQVVDFIDKTSGFPSSPNNNLYYYNTFATALKGSTGFFKENGQDQAISQAILGLSTASAGSTNLKLPLDDLVSKFQADTSGFPGEKLCSSQL
jgi:hypothetical protein